MSLLNAVLKVTISALNILDIYKALTYSSSHKGNGRGRGRRTAFEELGKSTILKTHASSPPTLADRLGSRHRRLLLKQALSLSVVWTICQGLEPLLDATIAYILPFYGSLKTLFLVWIFISRSAATFKLVHSWIRPVVKPYEAILDVVALGATAVLLNAIFLASLPISHATLRFKKVAVVRAVGAAFASAVRWLSSPRAKTSAATPTQVAATRRLDLVPPPVKKPRTPSSGSSSFTPPHPALRKQSSNSSLGIRKQPSISSIGIRKQPSISSISVSHRSTIGMGQPPATSHLAAARSVSSSSANGHPPTRIPSRTRTVSAVATATTSAAMQALQDLPPPPESRPSQPPPPPASGFRPGASGAFAFIPPPMPSTPTQHASSSATLFSPVVPGSFAPTPAAPTPLRMPPAAKADTPSSAKMRSSVGDKVAGATLRRGPAFQPTRRSTRASNAAKAKQSTDESEADRDEEMDDVDGKVVTPSKRRNEQVASTSEPSTRDRTTSLPNSNAKRQKLQVHEDETSTKGKARRPSTRNTSRASSMEVDPPPTAPTNGRTARRPPLSQAAKRAAAAAANGSGNASDSGSTTRGGTRSGTRSTRRGGYK